MPIEMETFNLFLCVPCLHDQFGWILWCTRIDSIQVLDANKWQMNDFVLCSELIVGI